MPEPAADRYAVPVGGVFAPPGAGEPASRPIDPTETTAETVETSPTKRLGVLGWGSILWLGGIALLALLAPLLPLPDPDKSYLEIVRIGPIQPGHPLGGDGSGRDILSRVIFGARASLGISVSAVVIGFVAGGLLG